MATYLAGRDATCTIDTISYEVEDGTINDGFQVDEVTNNFSGGYYEDVTTIRTATVTGMRIVYNVEKQPDFQTGDLVDVAIAIPDGPSLTGTMRVGNIAVPLLNVRSAVRMTFDLRSQGTYIYLLTPAGP